MRQLLGFLTHPSRWNAIEELPDGDRLWLAAGIFVLTVLLAGFAGALSSRWARRRVERAGETTVRGRIDQVRRGLVLLVFSVGLYLALLAAPLPAHLDAALSGAAYVLGAVVMARLVSHLVTLLLTTSLSRVGKEERERIEREYVPLTGKVTSLVVAMILVVVVAKHFGQDVTSLIAALGVGSLAIGLAAQQTLGNMIAGFVLLVDRPFRHGDRIRLATGEAGEVLEVGVRSTRILLGEGNLLIVPNAELVNSRVTNFAFPTPAARGEVKLLLERGADAERAVPLLEQLAAADGRVMRAPAPVARVTGLLREGIELTLGFQVSAHGDVGAVEDAVRRGVLGRFAEAGIELARVPLGPRAGS